MRGCLGLPFRLAGLAVLAFLAWVAWENRGPIRRWVHRVTAEPPPPTDAAVAPEELRRRAVARLDSLERGRADSVALTGRELEALLAPQVEARTAGALDSVALELGQAEVAVRARLDGDRLPRSGLGPLADWVAGQQRVEARGALGLRRVGVGEWQVGLIKVRGVPLPRVLWTRLAEVVAPGQGTVVTFAVPAWVTGIRVTPAAAVLYGRPDR